MPSLSFSLLLLIPLTAIAIPPITSAIPPITSATAIPPINSATTIGVTYSSPDSVSGNVLLSPETFAAKIVSLKIPAVRLLDSNPAMIGAFANTNVSLFISVPNHLVPLLARSSGLAWVREHVIRFHPHTKISTISVGNEVVSNSPDVPRLFLLRAMQNVLRSLEHHGIHEISVSTTFSFFNIIQTAFPPWSAQFQQPKREVIMRPILRFLESTNSSFVINLPKYHKLFDLMVEAVVSSLAVMGHENLPLIVAETGWPSSGINATDVDAISLYTVKFSEAVIVYLREGRGTPLRKEGVSEVYILELLDKDAKNDSDLLGDGTYINLSMPLALLVIALAEFLCVLMIRACIKWVFRRNSPPPKLKKRGRKSRPKLKKRE